jgi:uncharacterized ubiquitin-like protein YukD
MSTRPHKAPSTKIELGFSGIDFDTLNTGAVFRIGDLVFVKTKCHTIMETNAVSIGEGNGDKIRVASDAKVQVGFLVKQL